MNRKVAKLIRNLNERTKATILDIIESPTKWNLIQFYKSNPFSIHTPRGLANIIGRRDNQVYKEAEELATAGILKRISENGDPTSIYSYEPDEEMTSIINGLSDIDEDPRDLMEELLKAIKEN